MGQLIAFPAQRCEERREEPPHGRMALEVLYGLVYALGFFLLAPVLGFVALSGVFVGEPLTSAGALVLLAAVIPLASAARRRV